MGAMPGRCVHKPTVKQFDERVFETDVVLKNCIRAGNGDAFFMRPGSFRADANGHRHQAASLLHDNSARCGPCSCVDVAGFRIGED